MKNSTKVTFLVESGISLKTISKMNQGQINLMVERFKKFKKEESKEQVTKTTEPAKEIVTIGVQGGELPNNPTGKGYKIEKKPDGTTKATPMESEMTEDETDNLSDSDALNKDALQSDTGQEMFHGAADMADDGMGDDSGENRSMMGMAESKINEKFESKAQQGLFWARCEKCTNKNCKWCKMAKEFSDSTSKKQYKNMPEKKHPEKTVEKTNEGTQKDWETKILRMLEEEKKKKSQKKNSESMILRKPKKMTMFSDEAPMELPIAKMFSVGKK
jgi:hypothetical protein